MRSAIFQSIAYNRFFSLKKSKTLNVGMCGAYPEAMDWNIALRTQFSFWVSVSEEKALSEPENLQNLAKFLKCFWIQLQICLSKMKFEGAAQYFSLMPLDKHPTCLRLKFLIFLKKPQ